MRIRFRNTFGFGHCEKVTYLKGKNDREDWSGGKGGVGPL